MIVSASCISSTFKINVYSRSALFEEFFPLILALNLQMHFFIYASVLFILTQQDILSSSVSNIFCFLMPIAFTVISFLTSGSSSFGGWSSTLIIHSDSGFQRKAGPLNQRVTLLTFVTSKPLEPSSAGLSFDEMYFHCFIF